jgi:hypothetical protein
MPQPFSRSVVLWLGPRVNRGVNLKGEKVPAMRTGVQVTLLVGLGIARKHAAHDNTAVEPSTIVLAVLGMLSLCACVDGGRDDPN